MNTDEAVLTMIRTGSNIDYNNKAAKHSDAQLMRMYEYLCAEGFKWNHAMEICGFWPEALSHTNPMSADSIAMLKILKNY